MKLTLGIALALAAAVRADVPSLTPDNYDEMTDGKRVFIKFFAPWCGHCKKMAPQWEQLSDEWAGNESGLVAEVDCTAEGKPLCTANGVRGYPTLKYGDPADLSDYKGGRAYEDLAKFAKANLKAVCSPARIDLCDDEMKTKIENYMAKSVEELEAEIREDEKKLVQAEEDFKREAQRLKDGIGLMKSTKRTKEKNAKAGGDEL